MDDLLLYAKYARGYRQGSTNGQAAEGYNTFDPEKVDSYELGLKTTVASEDVKGTFDLAAFYNDLTSQQLQAQFNQPSGVAAAGIVNAGKSRIYGFEAETGINFFDYFNLSASYAYLNSRLVSTKPVTLTPGGIYSSASLGANPGDPLPFTPNNKLSVTGTVKLPLPEPIGRVSIGATYSYTGREFVSRASPFGNIQSTGLVDLNLDWKRIADSPLDLELFVTNAADRKYYTYVNTIYGTAGLDSWILSPPRMYGARLRYNFGK
jgi:iron complex outermembrane receptor protein